MVNTIKSVVHRNSFNLIAKKIWVLGPILLCLLITNSCTIERASLTLKLKDVILVDPRPGKSPFKAKSRLYGEGDSKVVVFSENLDDEIEFLSLDSFKIFKSIPTKVYKAAKLLDFQFIGRDSLLLSLSYVYFGDLSDPTHVIVHRDWVTDSFCYEAAPVLHRNSTINKQAHLMYPFDIHFNVPYDPKSRSIVVPLVSNYANSDSLRHFSNWAFLGRFYQGTRPYQPVEFCDKEFYLNQRMAYLPHSFSYPQGISYRNQTMLVTFAFSDTVWQIDPFATKDVVKRKVSMPSIFFEKADTNYHLKNNYSMEDNSIGRYNNLTFDPANMRIYRFCRIQVPAGSSTQEKNHPFYSVSVFDTAFHKLGEVLLPHGYSGGHCFPYKKGLLIYNGVLTFQQKKTVFGYFEFQNSTDYNILSEIETARKELSQTNGNIREYFDSLGIHDVSGKEIFLVPLEASCKSCVKDVGSALKKNQVPLDSSKVVIILIGSEGAINNYLNEHNLDRYKNIVFTDPGHLSRNYLDTWINPRGVKIDSSGNMVSDEQFNPDDIPLLIQRLLSFRRE